MADPKRNPAPGDPFADDYQDNDQDGYRDEPGHEARTALSALNLRTVFAVFGLVVCAFFAWWSIDLGAPVGAGILSFLALTAVVDLVVLERRRRQRAAGLPGRTHYSIFE